MFAYVFAGFIIIRVIMIILKNVNVPALKFKRKTKYVAGLFLNNFIDSRVLFVTRFKKLPSVGVVTQINVTDAYAFIKEAMKNEILAIHQANMFDHDEGKTFFNMTIMELTDARLIELGNGYAEVIYTSAHYEWAEALILNLAAFKIQTETTEEKVPSVVGFARAMEMN